MSEEKTEFKINFNSDALSLIRNLATINPMLLLESEDNKLKIDSRNPENTIAFEVEMSSDNFSFEGESVAFYDYKEFYTLLSSFKTPEIYQNNDILEIKSGKSKLTYYMANVDIIDKEYNYVDFRETHAKIKLSEDSLKKIKSYIMLLGADNVSFGIKDNKLSIKLFSGEKQPMYEDEWDLEESNGDTFEIEISKDIFTKSPEVEYTIHFHSAGIIKFEYKSNDIVLNLYTAQHEG